MVHAQVGEDGGGEARAAQAFGGEALRRHLHRDGLASGLEGLEKHPLQIERFGRGARGGNEPFAEFVMDRPDDAAGHAGRAQDVADHEDVVVLPFVPVTPTTWSFSEGWP